MTDPRAIASELETSRTLPDVPDWERLRGYAVAGVPFRSGHVLAMRRFPASSIGPGYTSVWHRDPAGRWVIYQDQKPQHACPRAFGPGIDDSRTVPIELDWNGSHRFSMDIDMEGFRLHWEVPLVDTPVTRVLNATASALPPSIRHNRIVLGATGRMAGPLLRAGRVRLAGDVPSGQAFFADLRRVWLIDDSTATLEGNDLGTPGSLPEQTHLADFWLPQRGLFAFADSFFEPYDPARHKQVASRREL